MSSCNPQEPNSYAGKLLAKEPTLKVNFSRASAAVSRAKAEKVARFLPNPEANWGPMAKHTRTGKVRPPGGSCSVTQDLAFATCVCAAMPCGT